MSIRRSEGRSSSALSRLEAGREGWDVDLDGRMERRLGFGGALVGMERRRREENCEGVGLFGQDYLRRKLGVGTIETALTAQGLLRSNQVAAILDEDRDANKWTRRHRVMDAVLCMEHRIARLQMAAHQWQQQQGRKTVATRDFFSQTTRGAGSVQGAVEEVV